MQLNSCSYKKAYCELRKRIAYHQFAPGEKICILRVAKILSMSSTPVREALSRLANEGFVECREQRGFFTRSVCRAEMQELLELLHIHTIYMCRQADSSGDLKSIALGLEAAFAHKDAENTLRGILDFRKLAWDIVDRPVAARQYEILTMRTLLYRIVEFQNASRLDQLQEATKEIVSAIRLSNVSRAFSCIDHYYTKRFEWFDDVLVEVESILHSMHAPNTTSSR